MMGGRALVLGGGGVTGIAWELGILAGLAEAGVDLTDADVIIGTSAGSVVGALVAGGRLATAYERQLAPATAERPARVSLRLVLRLGSAAFERDAQRARARVGALALATTTIPEQARRDVIAARLDGLDWPVRPRLLVTAVAVDDGSLVVFDRDSGVSLVDAVAASCAVPGVWPPVTIGERRYIDGGIGSPANVDLAAGAGVVVVLAPISAALWRDGRVSTQLASLPAGTRRLAVTPDAASRRAIGRNVLNPARRAGSARAGRAQAAGLVAAVRSVWEGS